MAPLGQLGGGPTLAGQGASSPPAPSAPPPSPRTARHSTRKEGATGPSGSSGKLCRPSRKQIQALLEKYASSANSSASASLGASVVTSAAAEVTPEESSILRGITAFPEPVGRPPALRSASSAAEVQKARAAGRGGLASGTPQRQRQGGMGLRSSASPGSGARQGARESSLGAGRFASPSKAAARQSPAPSVPATPSPARSPLQESRHNPQLHPSACSSSPPPKEGPRAQAASDFDIATAAAQGIGDRSASLLRAGMVGDVASDCVATPFGLGSLISARPGDGARTVQFPWCRAYLAPSCIDSSRAAVLECRLRSLRPSFAILVAELPRLEAGAARPPRRSSGGLRIGGFGGGRMRACTDADACSVSSGGSGGGLPAAAVSAVQGLGVVQSLVTWLEQAAETPEPARQRACLLDVAVVLSGLVRARAELARLGGVVNDPQLEVEKYAAGAVRIHLGLLERLEPASAAPSPATTPSVGSPAHSSAVGGTAAAAATAGGGPGGSTSTAAGSAGSPAAGSAGSSGGAGALDAACSRWREILRRVAPQPAAAASCTVPIGSAVVAPFNAATGPRAVSPAVRMSSWRIIRPGAKHIDRAGAAEEVQIITAASLAASSLSAVAVGSSPLSVPGHAPFGSTFPGAPASAPSLPAHAFVQRSPSPYRGVTRLYSASSMALPVGGATGPALAVGPWLVPRGLPTPIPANCFRVATVGTAPAIAGAMPQGVIRRASAEMVATASAPAVAVASGQHMVPGVVRFLSASSGGADGWGAMPLGVTRQFSAAGSLATPAGGGAGSVVAPAGIGVAPARFMSPGPQHRAVMPLRGRVAVTVATSPVALLSSVAALDMNGGPPDGALPRNDGHVSAAVEAALAANAAAAASAGAIRREGTDVSLGGLSGTSSQGEWTTDGHTQRQSTPQDCADPMAILEPRLFLSGCVLGGGFTPLEDIPYENEQENMAGPHGTPTSHYSGFTSGFHSELPTHRSMSPDASPGETTPGLAMDVSRSSSSGHFGI
mmetsp:Transcript_144088/g.461253  ORF Transcript_144088/g.461253 Transcript_144088/m.461253 type:complete len:1008 (-) Transcript_144088:122-3145(-)